MAKKPKKEAVKPPEEKGTLSKAKDSVVKAAGKVAEAVTHAAESVNEHVIHPVAEAVGIVKKPKKRFVREKVAKKTPAPTAKLATGSAKPKAKLMTKDLPVSKEKPNTGAKPRTGSQPKS